MHGERHLGGDFSVFDSREVKEVAPLAVELGRRGAVTGAAGKAAHHAVPQRAKLLGLVLLHMRHFQTLRRCVL